VRTKALEALVELKRALSELLAELLAARDQAQTARAWLAQRGQHSIQLGVNLADRSLRLVLHLLCTTETLANDDALHEALTTTPGRTSRTGAPAHITEPARGLARKRRRVKDRAQAHRTATVACALKILGDLGVTLDPLAGHQHHSTLAQLPVPPSTPKALHQVGHRVCATHEDDLTYAGVVYAVQ
jgi:hypothetical protein